MRTKSALLLGAALGSGLCIALKYLPPLLAKGKRPLRVLITGAAGQIGYALAPMVASGRALGADQPVILHLLDIPPAAQSLEGLKMELIDGAFPLLQGVLISTDIITVSKGVDVAIMVGGYPRKAGEERKDVMKKNVTIYKSQASALAEHAARDVKVVVVANPANTNALILRENAPTIPPENVTCLTRLDHNRALGQVAERTSTHVTLVKNVIIWGNHSSTQYPDVNHGTVAGKPIRVAVGDDDWLDGEFVATVQQRGAAIIKARGLSSALSAANAVCNHVHDWLRGTPRGTWTSMGVVSDGSYGVAPGLVFSYPVRCRRGTWDIVRGLHIDEPSLMRLRATEAELLEEKELALQCLAETTAAATAATIAPEPGVTVTAGGGAAGSSAGPSAGAATTTSAGPSK